MADLTPTPTKGLILCADDYAVHASASAGIVELARMGRLSATSAMVLSPRWPEDAAPLRELRDHIDVGLHLDWTSEFAVAAGHGLPLGGAMRRALLGGFDAAAARVEIERQLDAFEAQWQAPPDFVDGHQHVQQFAGIRQALVATLVKRYGGQAPSPYLRVSRTAPSLADLKSRVIAWMGADAIEKIAKDASIPWARGLFGIYDFAGSIDRYASLMPQWLAQAPAGAVLMCHPARSVVQGDEIGAARAREFTYLASPAFAQALAQAQVRPVRGRAVTPPLKFGGEQNTPSQPV